MTILDPKGVPINPFPKRQYEQSFKCATLNCTFILHYTITIQIPPGTLYLSALVDYVWECPKCGVLQTTQQDLPRSRPIASMELVGKAGVNGEKRSEPAKRKRKPKKKEGDEPEVKDATV